MAAIDLLAKRVRVMSTSKAPDVSSPCLSVCRMDPASELCEGCFRTLDEIAAWGGADDESKRAIWRLIGERIGPLALSPTLSQGERDEKQ
jgi:predicted Fe-S protein YdhL (DUF1289 family)